MKSIKGSLVGLVVAGVIALMPAAAIARGGGGGGGHFGGGHFGGGHFGGFTGHGFAGHRFAERQGAHFARHGDHFRGRDHFRHDGNFFFGDSFWYDYPYYGFDDPDYGYYDDNAGGDSDSQSSPAQATLSRQTMVAVQQALSHLGYYHGPIDGLIGSQTAKAVRWFQSVDKLSVTGQINGPTLKALRVS